MNGYVGLGHSSAAREILVLLSAFSGFFVRHNQLTEVNDSSKMSKKRTKTSASCSVFSDSPLGQTVNFPASMARTPLAA